MNTPVAVGSEALAATPHDAPDGAPISTRRALAFVYAGYALRYAYLLVLIPYYGRVLGAEEYGRLLAAMSLYTVVWMLAEYGFPVVGARDAAGCRDRAALADLFGRHAMGRLWMALPGLAVGIGGTILSPLLHANWLLGALATANGLLAAFNLGWFFQGTLRFRTSVMLEAAGFVINLPLILLLVRGPGDSAVALAILLGSTLVCTLVAYAIALRGIDRRAIRWRGGRQLVRDASALFAHKGFTMMMASSSTYLLSLFSGAAQVGWYGAAERLAAVGLSLMQPANHVLVGTVARQVSAEESVVDALRLMRGAAIAMTAFGVVLLIGTLALADAAVPLILGPDFGPSVQMLCTLGLLFPFAALSQVITSYVLIPLRHDTLVSRVSMVAALLTLLLVIAAAQWHAGTGVAWARVIGQVGLCIVLVVLLQRLQLIARIWRGA